MAVRMERLCVPLICSITKHKSLIPSSKVFLILVNMYCVCNRTVLRMHVDDDSHVFRIETKFALSIPYLSADSASHLLKIYFSVVG